jgi:prostatic aicd phosphatase
MTLGNGTNVTSPLGGYQYVKVATLLPSDDVDFEPFTNCANWTLRNTEVYNRTDFKARATEELPFFTSLKESGLLGNRTATLVNAYNVLCVSSTLVAKI